MSKFTFEYVKSFFYKNHFYLKDDTYINTHSKLTIVDLEGYKYSLSFNAFKTGIERYTHNFPLKFSVYNFYTEYNINNWIQINRKPFKLIDGKYKGNNVRNLVFQCDKCKESWLGRWDSIQSGSGCAVCDGKQIGKLNSLSYLMPDLSKEWNYEKNNLSPDQVTCGSKIKVWWKCSNCSFEWMAYINNRTGKSKDRQTGCPNCNLNFSKGNNFIRDYLLSIKIPFMKEHYFSDCADRGYLKFDFYIPSKNLCVEYQGEQHYKPIDFGGRGIMFAQKEFLNIKKRDKIKKKYCKENNINILIIPYWSFNKIKNILLNKLGGN